MAKIYTVTSGKVVAASEGLQVNVKNAQGYYDLVVNLNANGKAVRINDKFGEQRVHITVNEIPNLIAALMHVAQAGVKTSVEQLNFAA